MPSRISLFHPASEAAIARPHADRIARDLSLTEARDLLDWLEGHGLFAANVDLTPSGLMTIAWNE